jgi:hypothetical protein
MRVRTFAVAAVALSSLALAGCPKKDDDSSKTAAPPATVAPTPTPAPTPAPAPTPTAPTNMMPEGTQPAAGVELHVKAEVDNRPDGIPGTAVPVPGATAVANAPQNWQITKGPYQVASSADGKAKIAYGAGTDGNAGAAALGLQGCTWNPPDQLTIGAKKLVGQGADGLCHRGAQNVKAAVVMANGLAVVGAWDDGGDMASVFGSMRSITAAVGGVDPIAACCAALAQNAKSAPPQQVGMYMAAAGACNAARSNPQGRAALAQVRAMLMGAQVPASCR